MQNLGVELDPHIFGDGQPCFGCAPDHPIGFRLQFRRDEGPEGPEIVTTLTPGEQYQGPPGVMHGGLVSTLADELAAWTLLGIVGKFGFTADMSCRLRNPIRVGAPVEGRGRITHQSTRLVKIAVRLMQAGEECFTGDFSFVLLDQAGAEKLLRMPLPESWRRFVR